ncbi:MAG: hypothetical protein FIA99_05170 [Ruminiclostridium sp.]|nr:hypothetical protein [Ruminiclostridium sp.]
MKIRKIKVIILIAIILAINTMIIFAVSSGNADTTTSIVASSDQYELSLDKNIKFKGLVNSIEAKNLKKEEFYNQMAKYASLIKNIKPTMIEIEYINELAASGYDLGKLIDIYGFWKDTDDDINMIKTIYDAYDPELAQGDYWVEEIYNKVTDYKTGVLNSDDIDTYLEKGLTKADIAAANRLCRLGKLSIQQILDKKLTGMSWLEIIDQLYSQVKNRDKTLLISLSASSKEKYKEIKDGNGILDAEFLARRNSKDINTYLDNLVAGKSLAVEKNQYFKDNTEGMLENLRSQGLWDEPQDIKEKNQKAFEDLRKKIKDNSVSDEEINILKDKGYNELDILNASEMAIKHRTTIDRIIMEKEKGTTWDDIAIKGVEQ